MVISPSSSIGRLRFDINVHPVFAVKSACHVFYFISLANAGPFCVYRRLLPCIIFIRSLRHRSHRTPRMRHLRYEIRKRLEYNLALDATLAEVIGEVKARWKDDVFLKTDSEVFPLNEAVL